MKTQCAYRISIICLCMLFINKSFAFDDDLRKSLDRMFEKLDRTTVPTGLLRDYAVEEEDLDLFNGKSPLQNKNCVTGIQFMGLVNTINSADISGNSGIKNFKQEVTNYHYETNEIPLSILLYQYSQIKADALNTYLPPVDLIVNLQQGMLYFQFHPR